MTEGSYRVPDWNLLFGRQPDEFCNTLMNRRPEWVTGSLSHSDTRFLFRMTLECALDEIIELGTGSGFSTAILCQGLNWLNRAGFTGRDFRVLSYDASPYYWADKSRRVGQAAQEQLPIDLLNHITFRHPYTAYDLARLHGANSVGLMFIDANHNHPWPTLDLLAVLRSLKPDGIVIFHDINLPLVNPAFPAWGVKHLFDGLSIVKRVPQDAAIPNIGCIRIPADKRELRSQLAGILFRNDWQDDVASEYLRKLGVNKSRRKLENVDGSVWARATSIIRRDKSGVLS